MNEVWQPLRFDTAIDSEREALSELLRSGITAHDTIEEQLRELAGARDPRNKKPAPPAVPEHYGPWFYYPWLRRAVHLLPEAEFHELRCSRNRYKITAAEQTRLRSMSIAIAGLSVGKSSAVTLALEGIGGELRLADFDVLSLSNMNRLHAGVHELGLNKAVIAAREVLSIDPYLKVLVFDRGITEENVDRFLRGADLLVEECDDLFAKVRLREVARALHIPVIMETSDRGTIDIERFDLEPARPLFHGLAGELDAKSLRGLTTEDKVPIVLAILGEVSPELAGSMIEIGETLSTWPQLASAVALGGALSTEVVRRVALGELTASGRHHVDLSRLISDQTASFAAPAVVTTPPAVPPEPLGPIVRSAALSEEQLRTIVAHGTLAPSGGNCQPWKFVWRRDRLSCLHDVERSRSFLDFDGRAARLAIGAAVENMSLIAGRMGFAAKASTAAVDAVCELSFSSGGADDPLASAVAARVTNRRLGPRTPLGAEDRAALSAAGAALRVEVIEDPAALDQLGEILGAGDRLRFLHPTMHREMMHELRWSSDEALRTRDGIDLATLDLSPADRAVMRVVASPAAMALLRKIQGGSGLEKPSKKALAAASAAVLLSMPSGGSFFQAGRAMQRVWLTATARNLAVQPLAALIYLFDRQGGLDDGERGLLQALRRRFDRIFSLPRDHTAVILFRVSHADPPSARALRRRLDEVLIVER